MKSISLCAVAVVSALAVVACAYKPTAQAGSKVVLSKKGAKFELTLNGKPYHIKGAGGDYHHDLLVKLGGNSFRTWGSEELEKGLDQAQKDGLMVTAGIWLGHPGDGFDYGDKAKVAEQLKMCTEVVQKYKNHPALLMWAFGNEMEIGAKGPDVYKAINQIAAMAKKEDPNHPTMTVIAEIGDDKITNIDTYCPNIDIVGINSYGGGPSLPERYKKQKGSKPYVVTEFGPAGQWEVAKTSWGAPIEATSTQKAESYSKTYSANVIDNADQCLGSYTFLWGNKDEQTPTWFSMILESGEKTAAVDTISKFWTGKPVPVASPKIDTFGIKGSNTEFEPGESFSVLAQVTNADGKPSDLAWKFGPEKNAEKVKGAPELKPSVSGNTYTFTAPKEKGEYRLYLKAVDGKGGAAVANIPIRVRTVNSSHGDLPMVVYKEQDEQPTFQPTGWMGNMKAMALVADDETNPHSGKQAMRFDYSANDDWGGICWQYPANDWGKDPGSLNANGAKKMSFWMRGASGGEKVKVSFGIYKDQAEYKDSDSGETEVTLTKEWKQYSINTEGKDLSKLKSGFVVVVAGQGKPLTIFIDDVIYE